MPFPRPAGGPPAALLVAALVAVCLAGCFDDPVEETVHLEVAADGTVELTAVTRLSDLHLESDNPRLERRLRETERMLASGWDDWPRRFDAARPAEETITFHRQEGRLLEVERRAALPDPAAVNRFFADRLTAVYTPDGTGGGELAFYPTSGTRATGGERQQVERALEGFSAAVSSYLARVADLNHRLERTGSPEARAAYAHVFADLVPAEESQVELSGPVADRVERLRTAMDAVLAIFEVPPDDAFSLNELARKVYDPFPGRLSVTVPGEVVEVEGFVEDGGAWRVPGLDLWGAFAGLANRWAAPDPLLAYVEASRGFGSLDLDAWTARERSAAVPPSSAAVRDALEAGLRPAPVYRVAWRRR